MQQIVNAALERHMLAAQALQADMVLLAEVAALAQAVIDALDKRGTVFFAGNGGSFADAQHIVAEFVGRYLQEREGLPAVCLGVNSSTLTAVANDYGYDTVFARELRAMAHPGDVFVALSTSGNSPNIIAACKVAHEIGLHTWCITGQSGGALREAGERIIAVPSNETASIQEMHILIGHIICACIDAHIVN